VVGSKSEGKDHTLSQVSTTPMYMKMHLNFQEGRGSTHENHDDIA
jgi:hypothetical protein